MSISGKRIKKFFSFYRPYLGLCIADITCAFIVMVISLLLPLCIRYIAKNISAGLQGRSAEGLIISVVLVMAALILVQTAAALFYDNWGHRMGAMMERDMRNELFAHYQKLPFRFFDREKTGALMSRITGDLLNLAELYHHGPENIILYFLSFIGAFFILLRINSGLTLTAFAFLPIMAAYSLFFQKPLRSAYKRNREQIGNLSAQLEDSLAGIRVVKSFANEEIEEKKFREVNEDFYRARAEIYRKEAYYFTGLEYFFAQFIMAAVAASGAFWLSASRLDAADFIAFLLYMGYLTAPIPKLAYTIQQYEDGITGFNRFMDILEQEGEADEGQTELRNIQGRLELIDLGFRYAGDRENVFEGISLTVNPGQSVALVGSSGIGKTTLCSLIPRFYELNSGRILLDGINIRDIPLKTLRRSIGVVQQEVYLFSGSVMDNIRYGKPEAGEDEVIEAAKKAHAHDFILRLPKGYDSDIGPKGIALSGGQRQRLSIARVFLKNPPILIFDEATSALDNESERLVHQALRELAKDRTAFIIAHRLSTIKNAGRVLTLTSRGLEERESAEDPERE
ncbi:MAG: ABC transporter ATP-binding protein/permease [Treponema sp.]|nr:ABC transporter ATP-binding protein/permease [Treponema sp.]